jgi:hypothetical protein
MTTRRLASAGRVIVSCAVAVAIGGCGLADLRTAQLRRSGVNGDAAKRGDELLARMEQAHGGVDRLRSHRAALVDLEERWPSGFWGFLLNVWPDDPQKLLMSWLIDRDQVRAELTSGKHSGDVYGVQNWCYYEHPVGHSLKFKNAGANRKLLLPTLAFWYEAPLRIREAPIRAWAGERVDDGRTYDLLFATWNRAEPQKTIDQYVFWIDRETSRLAFVQVTTRDFAGWGHAFVSYDGWHDVSGILVPDEIHFRYGGSKRTDSVTRIVRTVDVRFPEDAPDASFLPEPTRVCKK